MEFIGSSRYKLRHGGSVGSHLPQLNLWRYCSPLTAIGYIFHDLHMALGQVYRGSCGDSQLLKMRTTVPECQSVGNVGVETPRTSSRSCGCFHVEQRCLDYRLTASLGYHGSETMSLMLPGRWSLMSNTLSYRKRARPSCQRLEMDSITWSYINRHLHTRIRVSKCS